MEQENLFDKIQEILGNLQGNFNVLEEQIDIDLQLEYFELSKDNKKTIDREEAFNERDDLFSDLRTIQQKKSLLVRLASVDKVEAFRTLERYRQNPDPELKDWASLAMHESKMLLEGSFLNENQVFISTGLGGKGQKLRYFAVFLLEEGEVMDDFKQKIIRSEMEYIFKKYDIEIEEIKFQDTLATLKAVIPIQVQLNQIFEKLIENCNQLGNFLQPNFIVTNVKELSMEEISEVLKSAKSEETIEEIEDLDEDDDED
jgi:hypothetical protein